MGTRPGVWECRGWWVTSSLGKPKEKLLRAGLFSRKEAEEVLRSRLRALAGGSPLKKALTVSELVQEYLEWVAVERSAGTHDWYEDKLAYLTQKFGPRTVASLTAHDGLLFKRWLTDERVYRKGGLQKIDKPKNSTVNMAVRAAKTVLRWAAKPSRAYIPHNPFVELGALTERPRERLLTDEEFSILLENASGSNMVGGEQDLREMLTLLRFTTMRPGELCVLEWDFIQWASHRIVFPDEVVKTRNRRRVTMVDMVEALLRGRMARLGRTRGPVFPKPAIVGGVLTAAAGDAPMTVSQFGLRFRRLFDRCVRRGLIEEKKKGERLVPYSTRHKRIGEMVEKNIPFKAIMDEAGHSTPRTTMGYIHRMEDWTTKSVRDAFDGPEGGSGGHPRGNPQGEDSGKTVGGPP